MLKRVSKKFIISAAVFAVLISFFIYKFISINQKYPQAQIETYKIGESVPYKQIDTKINVLKDTLQYNQFDVRVNSYSIINKDELSKLKCFINDALFEKYDTKAVVVNITVKNNSDKEASIETYYFALESPGWTNGAAYDCLGEFNEEPSGLILNLQPQEERSISLPFILYENQLRESTWKNISSRPFSLVLSLYPVKQVITLQ